MSLDLLAESDRRPPRDADCAHRAKPTLQACFVLPRFLCVTSCRGSLASLGPGTQAFAGTVTEFGCAEREMQRLWGMQALSTSDTRRRRRRISVDLIKAVWSGSPVGVRRER